MERDTRGGLEHVRWDSKASQGGPVTSPPRPPLGPAAAYPTIVARVSSRAALWIGAAWGFAEASLFFIVPDVWLGLVALFAPRRMLVTLAVIVAGAALGASCLFIATVAWPSQLESLILALPAIAPADLEDARTQLQENGASAILPGLLEGRAVKLYVHAAAADGLALADVVVFTVLNRLARLLLFGSLMMVIGLAGRALVARRPQLVVGLYIAGWVSFYAVHLAG